MHIVFANCLISRLVLVPFLAITRDTRISFQKAQTICTNMKQIIQLNEIKRHSYMKPSMMDISVFINDCHMVRHIFFETKFVDGRS